MKRQLVSDTSTSAKEDFLPIKMMKADMERGVKLAYKTTFSFKPFLKNVQLNIPNTCETTKNSLIESLEYAETHFARDSVDTMNGSLNMEMEKLVTRIMPSILMGEKRTFLSYPFDKKHLYQTPAMRSFYEGLEWKIKRPELCSSYRNFDGDLLAAWFIMKERYGYEVESDQQFVFTLKNTTTSIVRYFQMDLSFDHVALEVVKKPKTLTHPEIQKLFRNPTDKELWLKAFPPKNYMFSGMVIGTFRDVTKEEILNQMKDDLVNFKQESSEQFLLTLQQNLRSFLNLSDLDVGSLINYYARYVDTYPYSLAQTNDVDLLKTGLKSKKHAGIYHQLFTSKRAVILSRLEEDKIQSIGGKRLYDQGYRSVMLIPMLDEDKNIMTVMEVGSKTLGQFNALTYHKIKGLVALVQTGAIHFTQRTTSEINAFIQKKFTAIHPSVYWKFEEVATRYQLMSNFSNFDGRVDPIVFKNIHPLYGQTDIVGSSVLRNNAIQADLIDNLERLEKLLKVWKDHLKFHLVDAYLVKVSKILARLQEEFISSDESIIAGLLTNEIHPMLEELADHYPDSPTVAVSEAYFNDLDPNLGIVYQQRKAYEDSVSQLNRAVSSFLEREDANMQEILPHYFEKYTTDGAEYTIYVGQELLKEAKFSPIYLKDFRLWQLVQTCELTRLVENLSPHLPMPLQTAQLIFAYSATLSIRFRMEEKQFDVDGAYNVRYEIMKKRIDKALVKGTTERLTQAGRIAIVYVQESERLEYLEYLQYLIDKEYIEPNIEELELEKLQGTEGLKALRVCVVNK